MSLNETNAWRTTRARTVAQLRLFGARMCYADSWIMYGFEFLRRDGGNASHRERLHWPAVRSSTRTASAPTETSDDQSCSD
jgi:hypothetical protein